jgi:AcrR family transcriptional regulator
VVGRPATGYAVTRERLLGITRDAIAVRGVDRLTLAEVATAAGLTVPSLYHYFRDRRDLVLAALQAEISDSLRAVTVSGERADSPEARVRMFLERQAEYLTSTRPPTLAFVLGSLLRLDDDELRATASEALGHAEVLFGDAVAHLRPDGSPTENKTSTDVLRACLAGLFLIRAVDADVDVDAVAGQMAAFVDGQFSR